MKHSTIKHTLNIITSETKTNKNMHKKMAMCKLLVVFSNLPMANKYNLFKTNFVDISIFLSLTISVFLYFNLDRVYSECSAEHH